MKTDGRSQGIEAQFGLAVRRHRQALSLSQEELASIAGLHRTYITDIERGARNPSLQSIAKLCSALGVSFASLFKVVDQIALEQEEAKRSAQAVAATSQ
jgi:transcriptional regulator with XRE-family HTH domain